MAHERMRKFNTRDVYTRQALDNDMCMVVKAGNRLFLRGQTGLDLNQQLRAPEDAAAQADQAMQNVKQLLEEVGSELSHICKITIYICDRAYRDPVYQVIGKHLKGVFPCSTGLIVDAFARPEYLMEIDVMAVIPDA